MSRPVLLGVLVGVVLALVVALGLWLGGGSAPDTSSSPEMASALPSSAMTSVPPVNGVVVAEAVARPDVPLPPAVEPPVADGVEALRQARLEGDARSPAVVRSTVTREEPTAAELADPKAYQRYEARQNERLYRSYVKAADAEIPKLQEQLSQGKQGGLTPEQIAEGEEKLRRIEEMRNQLMSDHPELTRPAAP